MNHVESAVWMARAFQGKYLSDDYPKPYVSELAGEIIIEQVASPPAHPSLRFLTAVKVAIEAEMKFRQPLDPDAILKSFMTMIFGRLPSIETGSLATLERVARIDLVIGGGFAFASADIAGLGHRGLDAQPIGEGDCAWEVAVLLLDNLISVTHSLTGTESSRQPSGS